MPKTTEIMKGINAKMDNRLDHNTLNSNVQVGDNNNEETENVNLVDNEEKEATYINGDIHIHEGGFHMNPRQRQIGGSADQNPNTKNALTTDHALNMLFAFIGLAIFAVGIGIAISCISKKKRKRKRSIRERIQNHREKLLMREIKHLKSRIDNEQQCSPPAYNPNFFENSKNDIALPMNFSSSSDISAL